MLVDFFENLFSSITGLTGFENLLIICLFVLILIKLLS